MIRICHRPGRNEDERQFDVCVTTYEMVLKNLSNLKHFAWQYVISFIYRLIFCWSHFSQFFQIVLDYKLTFFFLQDTWSSMKDTASRTKTRFCRKLFVNCTRWTDSCWQVRDIRYPKSQKHQPFYLFSLELPPIAFRTCKSFTICRPATDIARPSVQYNTIPPAPQL